MRWGTPFPSCLTLSDWRFLLFPKVYKRVFNFIASFFHLKFLALFFLVVVVQQFLQHQYGRKGCPPLLSMHHKNNSSVTPLFLEVALHVCSVNYEITLRDTFWFLEHQKQSQKWRKNTLFPWIQTDVSTLMWISHGHGGSGSLWSSSVCTCNLLNCSHISPVNQYLLKTQAWFIWESWCCNNCSVTQ